MLAFVEDYQNTSAIDVWGLGCILLELIHGVPIWLSNNTKIKVGNHYETKKGLFSVNDRSFSAILEKQLQVSSNLDEFLRHNVNMI